MNIVYSKQGTDLPVRQGFYHFAVFLHLKFRSAAPIVYCDEVAVENVLKSGPEPDHFQKLSVLKVPVRGSAVEFVAKTLVEAVSVVAVVPVTAIHHERRLIVQRLVLLKVGPLNWLRACVEHKVSVCGVFPLVEAATILKADFHVRESLERLRVKEL